MQGGDRKLQKKKKMQATKARRVKSTTAKASGQNTGNTTEITKIKPTKSERENTAGVQTTLRRR